MDLPIFVVKFIEQLRNDNKAASTIRTYTYDLKKFFEWLSKYKPGFDGEVWGELTRKDYEQYFTHLKEQNLSEANLKRLAASLNKLIQYYHLQDHIGGPLKPEAGALRELTDQDFITNEEAELLIKSIASKKGLTDNQLSSHEYLADRNLSIVILMLTYGLKIEEVSSLNMEDVNFGQNIIYVHSNKDTRTLSISTDHQEILLHYYSKIPELFRPRYHTDDPFFVAFNPKKNTYKFDYVANKAKRLKRIGIQRAILKEVQRSGIDRPLSATHLRNTCILNHLRDNVSNDEMKAYFGISSRQALYRYKRCLQKNETD